MEKKYDCKVCKKSFLNGKVLGGHMRSHMIWNFAKKVKQYGLREKPKKSWKGSNSDLLRLKSRSKPRMIKRGSRSMGCIKVRSVEGKEVEGHHLYPCPECGELSGSLKSLSNHKRIHSKKSKVGSSPPPVDILADAEPLSPVRRKRSLLACYDSPPIPKESDPEQQPRTPSSVSEDEQDVKELALGLMLLSRGLRDPVDELMGAIPSLNQVYQTVKDDDFGVKKLSETDRKEVHPSEDRKLLELEAPVDMVHQEIEFKNTGDRSALEDRETEEEDGEEAAKLGDESKKLEGNYYGFRKKAKFEDGLKENENMTKNLKGSAADHGPKQAQPESTERESRLSRCLPLKTSSSSSQGETIP